MPGRLPSAGDHSCPAEQKQPFFRRFLRGYAAPADRPAAVRVKLDLLDDWARSGGDTDLDPI